MRGVLTGVLRVAKESIFSGLNNVERLLNLEANDFATSFGFTQQGEVDKLAVRHGRRHDAAEAMRAWYDGYRFAGHAIYNPWSVLMYASEAVAGLSSLLGVHRVGGRAAGVDPEARPPDGRGATARCFAGDAVAKVVDEHVVLRELEENVDAVWNLLLHDRLPNDAGSRSWCEGRIHAQLAIPNEELRIRVRARACSRWMRVGTLGSASDHARCSFSRR